MSNLFAFLSFRSWLALLIAALAGMVSGLSSVALLAVINRTLQYPASIDSLWPVFAELCGSFIAARLLSEYVVIFLGQNTIRDMRLRLCREILDVPLARFQEMGPGKVLVNLTEDVAVISEALTRIPSICVNFAVVLGGVFYLGWLSMDILWVATRTTQTARPSSGIWKIVLFMCLMSGRRIKIRYSKSFFIPKFFLLLSLEGKQ